MNDSPRPGIEDVIANVMRDIDAGRVPDRQRLLAAHPELGSELRGFFAGLDALAPALDGSRPGAASHAWLDPVKVGDRVGPYRIDRLLGRGGMGCVFLATQLALDRPVAIKFLNARRRHDPAFADRMKREAKALARLEHPNIVSVFDLGEHEGALYFVMQYVDGVMLRDLIDRKELTPAQSLSLVQKICAALAYAHSQGIVHRDIKPENILVDRAGEPRIADFGLARVLDPNADATALTRSDVVMGTIQYMAPEQRRSAAVDHRADIYSLGVVLYEMLTGEIPYGNAKPPSKGAACDTRIDDVVRRALEEDPASRYQRADEMGQDVSDVITPGASPPVRRGSPREIRLEQAGKTLGTITGKLILRSKSDESLSIQGWGNDYAMLRSDSTACEIESGNDHTSITLSGDDWELFVPRELEIEIDGGDSEIDVSNLAASLHIRPGEGDVGIKNHQGRLECIRLDWGSVSVDSIESSSIRIEVTDGSIDVLGLSCNSGEVRLQANDGDVNVGVLRNRSQFDYRLRSAGSSVSDTLSDSSADAGEVLTGRIGREGGHVEIETVDGSISIGDDATLRRFQFIGLDGIEFLAVIVGCVAWFILDSLRFEILAAVAMLIVVRRGMRWIGSRFCSTTSGREAERRVDPK